MTDEGLKNLQYAIVIQAIADYGRAIQRGDLNRIREIRDFFTGEWFELISPFPMMTGLDILEKLSKNSPKQLARCQRHCGK